MCNQTMNKKRWMIAGGVLGVVVLIASVGAMAVHAQTPTPTGPWGSQGELGNGRHGARLGPAELAAAAKALGMTTTDLSDELKSGKTLSDIATEKGVDLQSVKQAIQTAHEAEMRTRISRAVSDGKMTQERADWLLQGLSKGYLSGPGLFGFGFGGPRGPHGHPGGPQGQPAQQTAP